MSRYLEVIKKESKPRLTAIRDDIKARKDPEFFWPSGTQVYTGKQGSGKTISAVRHLIRLKDRYPRAIVVSNISLTRLSPVPFETEGGLRMVLNSAKFNPSKHYIQFHSMKQLEIALVHINNEHKGVIYVIDEIHTYFNALDSANIPMYVFTEISQQRKQRKVIIGTSQLFLRLAKPFREQCESIIVCTTRLGVFTKQMAYDGMTIDQDYGGKITGDLKKRGWFWQTRKLRGSFDTYQKVVSGAQQYAELNKT